MAERRGRGGRPARPNRDTLLARPPLSVGDAIRDRADELGLTISDYITAVLAREVGMSEAAPLPAAPVKPHDQLELTGAPTRKSA